MLPGKEATLVGVNSLWVIVFDALLVMSIALCFSEMGSVIPVLTVVVSIWLLTQSSLEKVFWGLGGLVVGAVLYYIMNRSGKQTA